MRHSIKTTALLIALVGAGGVAVAQSGEPPPRRPTADEVRQVNQRFAEDPDTYGCMAPDGSGAAMHVDEVNAEQRAIVEERNRAAGLPPAPAQPLPSPPWREWPCEPR